jgi:CRP-like cAMP-binding protein
VLTVADCVADLAVFAGLSPAHLRLISGCGRFARFTPGAAILREGQPADRFYVIRQGSAALEVASPERGPIVIQTLGPGDTLGWSWLFPPYRWHLDATATGEVSTVAFDAVCLRAKCDSDHELGYQLMDRFANIMLQRLMATRLQLLDVYAHGSR